MIRKLIELFGIFIGIANSEKNEWKGLPMKQFICITALITTIFANDTLVTNEGKKVILKDDFTWEYLNENQESACDIKSEGKILKFIKNEKQKAKLKSKKYPYTVYYDASRYVVKQNRGAKEFMFTSKDQSAFLMTITEEAQMNIDLLLEAAIYNAKNGTDSLQVIAKGDANINGVDVKTLIMEAKLGNYNLTYYGCYYSSEDFGSIQMLSWTYSSLFEKKKKDLEEIFSGFVLN